jgi:hypothetical protein
LLLLLMLFVGSCGKYYQGRQHAPKYQIVGKGMASNELLALFLYHHNSSLSVERLLQMADLYIEECQTEGLNHDVAFAQMCLETGYLRYGGIIYQAQYNFAGLGATGKGAKAESYADVREGIRAHVQHLKAYASSTPLHMPLVDNRFAMVERGCCPTVFHLSGKWAADKQYGNKLAQMIVQLLNYRG